MPPVHIIVPVYKGIELTRRCLSSLIASSLPGNCRITLIDDASPEAEMAEMLRTFVDSSKQPRYLHPIESDKPEWEILSNDANRGFVVSTNIGMARYPDHDVVLLNSDTEVPPGWLQRLQAAAYRKPNIGTVTPFSNNASIAGYPVPCTANPLPDNFTVKELDRLFQMANAGELINVPTGVGFCFFIRRDCLNAIGAFDEAAFGKGYGEENDFCLRASKKGWSHVLAADCFAFHQGRASFGAEQEERSKLAYAALVDRYPQYPSMVQRHFLDDPARPLRQRVDALRLIRSKHEIVLVIDNEPADDLMQVMNDDTSRPVDIVQVLLLVPRLDGQIELRWLREGEAFRLWFRLPDEVDDLHKCLLALGVVRIHRCHWPKAPKAIMKLVDDMAFAPSDGERKNHREMITIPPTYLYDLVSRHSYPKFTGKQMLMHSLRRLLVNHVLRIREYSWARPLAAKIPPTVQLRLRHWLKKDRP